MRRPQHPPREKVQISDSQVKNHNRCARRWAYQSVMKIDPPGEDKWNLIYGSGVHEGLEQLHRGNTLAGAITKGCGALKEDGKGEETQDMFDMLPAMLDGYTRHFLPQFSNYWMTGTTAAGEPTTEVWFEHLLDPYVEFRGKRDLFCVSRNDANHTLMADFKTTSQKDGGELGMTVLKNPQLARYCVSYCRQEFQWPKQVALIFLQKPKLKNFQSVLSAMRENPQLYSMKSEPVTPAFAEFALALEQVDLATGHQMYSIQRGYDERGLDAIDRVPANFDNCRMYGRDCGFIDGCHSGKPFHRRITL